ncbi:FAD-dependent monooxygenase [Ramlibacter sp. PS4R-6]|uniref:FAD-dependent monooxygenase n=1 Tax=Ramlibacter sp. PS4R-6 TaxID=3133438 RepID=UPI0030B7568C
MPVDVCIRGAGIVGRTLALLLAQARLRVALVRSPQQAAGANSDVRAYALNAASKELLERVRAWPDDAHATPVCRMEVHGDAGGELFFRAEDQAVPALAWIVDVGALLARLEDALRYAPQVQWVDAPQPAALTVVTEGRASSTRDELHVPFEVTPYPQHAIAARLECEKPHDGVARQWFSQGEILALLPLGGRSVALVWSVADARSGGLLSLDAAAFTQAVEAACHGALGKMTLASERAAWPLQLARAQRWCGPGWVLAGDAAHTVHPLAGQGLNLGLGDARELAQVLQEREYWRSVGDLRLLRRYERSRKADVLAMGAVTDGLQQLFARGSEPWSSLRNWGMTGVDRTGPVKDWLARRAMG